MSGGDWSGLLRGVTATCSSESSSDLWVLATGPWCGQGVDIRRAMGLETPGGLWEQGTPGGSVRASHGPTRPAARRRGLGLPWSSAHARHANNVQFVKWAESARIRYFETLDLPAEEISNVLVSVSGCTSGPTITSSWSGALIAGGQGNGCDFEGHFGQVQGARQLPRYGESAAPSHLSPGRVNLPSQLGSYNLWRPQAPLSLISFPRGVVYLRTPRADASSSSPRSRTAWTRSALRSGSPRPSSHSRRTRSSPRRIGELIGAPEGARADGSTLVMYDYDHLTKGTMSDTFRDALLRRIKH
jgi:hypothetical protein